MQVKKTQWDKSEISRILVLFPGEMNQLLRHATPQEIIRAKEFLPIILWRWFFLRSEIDNLSPYLYLEWRRDAEEWPKDGQFIPEAKLTMPKTAKPAVTTEINVDYISFDEQPLLVDIRNKIDGKPNHYIIDNKYKIETESIGQNFYLLKKNRVIENLSSEEIIESYLSFCLYIWREEKKDIKKVFSMAEWLDFWQKTFKKIDTSDEKGYGADLLVDSFIRLMRAKIKDYGVLTSEIEEKERQGDEIHLRQWGLFWYDFCYFLLVPLSWYLSLIAPYFGMRENFANAIKEILNNYHQDPTPLYASMSSLKFTPFGKKFFKNFEFKKVHASDNIAVN